MNRTSIASGVAILAFACGGFACSSSEADDFVVDVDTQIRLPQGFDAELLYTVPESQGSWVAMAFDPEGRIVVSDQDDKGVFRVTLPKEGAPKADLRVNSLKGFPFVPVAWGKRTVAGALGFLHAFDSLYMSTMRGFYRIRDTDGDDQYDEFTLLKELHPGWEHSAHSILKTVDGTALYLISGNHSKLPDGVRSLQAPVWGLDSLHEPLPDPSGHARGVKAPGGWICRISPDGQDWTMVASGLRNAVDLAVNREGELFTYDSDLEFDIGCPWYRPTRVNHVTSASEFGWRAGSAKWPDYFEDSNGSVIDIGPGSPTAISFGYESSFPDEYKDKLFICDWTFGTIYTLDLVESGSSYTAMKSIFLSGEPLNITAMRFGPDGHMYFLIGGRNSASKLYRIRYTGSARKGARTTLVANQELRDLRHALEAFHGSETGGQAAIDRAWPHLSHDDRAIRYAARLAIESQSFELWRDRVFGETDSRALIHATIALCRHGDRSLSSRVVEKLRNIDFNKLEQGDRLALLRAYSLCWIRLGAPTELEREAIADQLDPYYPAPDEATNTELCRVLTYLESKTVVHKTIGLMKTTQAKTLAYDKAMLKRHAYGKPILEAMANTPNSQNIHYAYFLRRVQTGWSLAHRKYYFTWLNDTLHKSGGQSFEGYIRAIREDAIEHLPSKDAAAVAWLLDDVATLDLSTLPLPKGPPGMWTTDTAMDLFNDDLRGRNYENGKAMFAAGRCVACHRFEGEGGRCGPDLGSVGKRYTIRDILVAICEPDETISEQYHASLVTLVSGETLYGRVIYQNDTELALATNRFDFSKLTKIPAAEVKSVERSPTSMMPPETIAMMNKEEVADLVAYLVSGGDKKHRVFQR